MSAAIFRLQAVFVICAAIAGTAKGGAESEIPELSPAQASPYPVLQLFVVLTNTSASERTESDTLGRKLQEMDTSIVADDILFSITFVPRSPSEDLLRDIPSNDTDLFLDDMAANGNLTLFDKSLRIAVLPVVNGTGSAHVPVTRTHHSFKAVYDGLTFENATIVVTVINPDGSWQPAEEEPVFVFSSPPRSNMTKQIRTASPHTARIFSAIAASAFAGVVMFGVGFAYLIWTGRLVCLKERRRRQARSVLPSDPHNSGPVEDVVPAQSRLQRLKAILLPARAPSARFSRMHHHENAEDSALHPHIVRHSPS